MQDEILISEKKLLEKISMLEQDIMDVQQNRSDYALEHFVAGLHSTPGRQRMQILNELTVKLFGVKRTHLEMRKLEIKIEQARERAKSRDVLDAQLAKIEIEEYELSISEMELARLGNVRETKKLLSLLDNLPAYTREEYEKEEPTYWNDRIATQILANLKVGQMPNPGDIMAAIQMQRQIGNTNYIKGDAFLKAWAALSENIALEDGEK